jgi:hypothetical protein
VNGRELTFGVSGLLYKSNVLMYDKETESLWSQVKNQAVTGPMTGAKLNVLPSSLTAWEKWKKKHPDTMVLSLDTGYDRDYSRDPYAEYHESRSGFFGFFRGLFEGHEGKELVAGVTVDGHSKAYPLEKLRQLGKATDTVAGKTLTFSFDPVTGDLEATDAEGNRVPYITAYWFVWKETHPETELFGGIDN